MQAIRSKDTKPELFVRSILHALGYRFRIHLKDLPGKPDITFTARRKIIFIHGCFWHGHDDLTCVDRARPRSNTSYWNPKLDRNAERDRSNVEALKAAGWDVIVVWECEIGNSKALSDRLVAFLGDVRHQSGHCPLEYGEDVGAVVC